MGNLPITLLLFIIMLVAFHGVMLALGPRRRFWKKVEYVCLGAAAVGLIGATGVARQAIAGQEETGRRIRFESDLQHAKWWANTSLQYFTNQAFATVPPADEKEKEIARQFLVMSNFYRDVLKGLGETPESRPWKRFVHRAT